MYMKKQKAAAIKVQTVYRGHLARKQIAEMQQAATKIQCTYRGMRSRLFGHQKTSKSRGNRVPELMELIYIKNVKYSGLFAKPASASTCHFLLSA